MLKELANYLPGFVRTMKLALAGGSTPEQPIVGTTTQASDRTSRRIIQSSTKRKALIQDYSTLYSTSVPVIGNRLFAPQGFDAVSP